MKTTCTSYEKERLGSNLMYDDDQIGSSCLYGQHADMNMRDANQTARVAPGSPAWVASSCYPSLSRALSG